MKHRMTTWEIMECLPSTPGELAQAGELLDILGVNEEQGFCNRMVAEGVYHSITVHVDGVPAVVLYYNMLRTGLLHINQSATLGTKWGLDKLGDTATTHLAKQLGASTVTCHTTRKGHVELAVKLGWKIEGVLLSKRII